MSQFISSIVEWISANRECFSMTIDIIGTIATVAAVIVAIVANHKANQSIKYSLKMQEQSKNIDLFEKRVALINDIKENNTADSVVLKLLYQEDERIFESYNKLQILIADNNSLIYQLKLSMVMHKISDGEGGYLVTEPNLIESDNIKNDEQKELSYRIKNSTEKIQKQKEELLELMQMFIQKSIASIKN